MKSPNWTLQLVIKTRQHTRLEKQNYYISLIYSIYLRIFFRGTYLYKNIRIVMFRAV